MIDTSTSISLPPSLSQGDRARLLAKALFVGGGAAHRLPRQAGGLVQHAAAYLAAARALGHERAWQSARDAALAAPIGDLSAGEQAIVACAVALQRDRARPRREPTFVRLSPKERRCARRIAALLRLADALAATPAAHLAIANDGDGLALLIAGASEEQIAAVDARADQWRSTVGPLAVSCGEGDPGGSPAPPPPALETAAFPGPLSGEEPVAEGARRVLRRFFEKLLAREEGVRKGEDPEDIHQMRVATRRLRAALQVTEEVYERRLLRRYRRGLRRLAQSLGAVRDADVFLEALRSYRGGLEAGEQCGVDRLLAAVEGQRAVARERLLAELGAKRYKKLKREIAAFLTTPGAGANGLPVTGAAPRVRDVAGSAIWRRYEQWRAFETALPGASDEVLHQARIAGKWLRYTLEFFAEALGPRVEEALGPLIALQEHLGALQDEVTTRARIAALGLEGDAGARAYLAARAADAASQRAALGRHWEKVASATYRRRLWELITRL